MKIVTASNGKQTIKLSKSDWQAIGKKAGWLKAAEEGDTGASTSDEATDKKMEAIAKCKKCGCKCEGDVCEKCDDSKKKK